MKHTLKSETSDTGDYAETNQTVLSLPEDVGGEALELLLHGMYLQEVRWFASLLLIGCKLLLSHAHGTMSLLADPVQQGQC